MTIDEKRADYLSTIKSFGFNFSTVSEDSIANAPAGLSKDTGVAYDGAMISHAILTFAIAKKIAQMIASTFTISEESLRKVIYFQGISKATMFVPNDNSWEIEKRGFLYKFNPENKAVLKGGERSIFLATSNGVTFTEEEFEAMRILDKEGDELKLQKFNISPLSLVVSQANELAYAMEKARSK